MLHREAEPLPTMRVAVRSPGLLCQIACQIRRLIPRSRSDSGISEPARRSQTPLGESPWGFDAPVPTARDNLLV